ncbi:ribonuclease-domain-containing protein [Hypoxylon cercidicola]|nr:ribonuclease-domain-containing protein [Hypoxylon cercidicola]
MKFIANLLPFAALLASVAAAPVEERAELAATTCGSHHYSADAVNQASQRACSYYQSGQAPSSYPHRYNNYEGFNFPVSGPYLEFPILSNGNLFSGGSPGADRVIINTSCRQAGAITHTGASGNNFVGCTGTN